MTDHKHFSAMWCWDILGRAIARNVHRKSVWTWILTDVLACQIFHQDLSAYMWLQDVQKT